MSILLAPSRDQLPTCILVARQQVQVTVFVDLYLYHTYNVNPSIYTSKVEYFVNRPTFLMATVEAASNNSNAEHHHHPHLHHRLTILFGLSLPPTPSIPIYHTCGRSCARPVSPIRGTNSVFSCMSGPQLSFVRSFASVRTKRTSASLDSPDFPTLQALHKTLDSVPFLFSQPLAIFLSSRLSLRLFIHVYVWYPRFYQKLSTVPEKTLHGPLILAPPHLQCSKSSQLLK